MKKIFLLLSIFICFNYSYSQLTLSSVEFLNNQRDLTFTNPVTNATETRKLGLCIGKISDPHNGKDVCYYSYDITPLSGSDTCLPNFNYVDDPTTIALPKVVYIVYNYYPAATGPGQLGNITNEVASIQCAIWHYTNGLDINTITSNSIKTRANAIVANVDANGGSATIPTVLKIVPDSDPSFFFVKTIKDNNSGVAVTNIALSITQGTLSTYSVNTNSSGISPSVEVDNTNTGIITAVANMQVPKGTIFKHVYNYCKKVILACPGPGTLKATLDWGALPIELASFTSNVNRSEVTLNWSTASEINNNGFDIEKLAERGEWTKVGFVNGNGTTTDQNNYSFRERNLNSGRYSYRLKQIDFNGNFEYFNLSNFVSIGIPQTFSVSQNYPNPFNPTTKVNYDLPFDGNVTMKVFDMTGKEVLSLLNGTQTAGYYTVSLDASRLSSGVYFYRVNLDGNGSNFVMTKKMIVVK